MKLLKSILFLGLLVANPFNIFSQECDEYEYIKGVEQLKQHANSLVELQNQLTCKLYYSEMINSYEGILLDFINTIPSSKWDPEGLAPVLNEVDRIGIDRSKKKYTKENYPLKREEFEMIYKKIIVQLNMLDLDDDFRYNPFVNCIGEHNYSVIVESKESIKNSVKSILDCLIISDCNMKDSGENSAILIGLWVQVIKSLPFAP